MTPLSGCWSVEIACRRACRSPLRASVISFSISGLTALAFASVVLMRSWSMTSTHRLASRAFRCEASRESLPRAFWWRIGGPLVVAQRQAALVEGLDDLVDRLLAEVRDRIELALGLRDQVADRLDPRPLEAVVRADAQLELLDEDVVHPAGARRSNAVDPEALGSGDQRRALVAQRLYTVGVGEDRQVLDQDLGGLAQRGL